MSSRSIPLLLDKSIFAICSAKMYFVQDLHQVLPDKILPWTKAGIAKRLIVAHRKMSGATVPSGVKVIPRKIPGKRGRRIYGNTRLIAAQWPEAEMLEMEINRLVCVVEGQIHFCISNLQLGCKEGDFIVIPAGVPHPGESHPATASISDGPCVLLRLAMRDRCQTIFVS